MTRTNWSIIVKGTIGDAIDACRDHNCGIVRTHARLAGETVLVVRAEQRELQDWFARGCMDALANGERFEPGALLHFREAASWTLEQVGDAA